MLNPRLSIIIPTYNERHNINPLIDRLFEKEQNIEVIVVDSARTEDGTLDAITHSDVKKIASDKATRAEQMHEGVQASAADLLYFVHADALLPIDYFELISEALENGSRFGLFSYRFDSDSSLLRLNSSFTRGKGLFTGGGDQSMFIQKKTYLSMQGFDTSLPIMEDFDFYWRLKRKDIPYALIPVDVIVSARKYERNSYLKVQLVNLVTLLGFKWGRSPQKLKKFYNRMLD
jgi:rSAM/selenodomain-associated transferase 2